MTKQNFPTSILASDYHLTHKQPICRKDNYKEAEIKKLDWLHTLQLENNPVPGSEYVCPILSSGDIFDEWFIPPELSTIAIKHFPKTIAIPGQHDLPNHNLELIENSGYSTLQAAGNIENNSMWERICIDTMNVQVKPFPFGMPLCGIKKEPGEKFIALIHTLVLGPKDEKMKGSTVNEIFDKMPGFDLIVCGDNHKAFTVKHPDGRLFVSPGSMMRMSADQIDYKPRVYLWYADTNTVEPEYYPIEEGVVSREHIEKKEIKEGMLDAFVQTASAKVSVSVSFEQNMVEHLQEAKVSSGVEDKIWKAMGK